MGEIGRNEFHECELWCYKDFGIEKLQFIR